MKKSIQIKQELQEIEASVAAILATAEQENRELTSEESAEVNASIDAKIPELKTQLESAQKREAFQSEILRAKLGDNNRQNPFEDPKTEFKLPAKAKGISKVKHFANEQDAYICGQYILGHIMGKPSHRKWCDEHGVKAAMIAGDNPTGGYLVPEPLEAAIIELREAFGVFRRYSRVWPMADGVQIIPKLAGEVSTFFVGENSSITPSDMRVSQVKLEAKKLASLTLVSSELSEDAVITVADLLARSIAQSMAEKEDECGFNGDGTSPFGGIVGLSSALLASSRVTATGQATFGALTLGSFEAAKGRVRRYAGMQPAWFISSTGYYASMDRLMNAAGGNSNTNLAAGSVMNFLGDPVVFTQVMEDRVTSVTGSVACYYGDLAMTAYMGSRRGISVIADSSRYFDQDAVAIRSTQRFDINVHERGSSTATNPAGSMVALIFG